MDMFSGESEHLKLKLAVLISLNKKNPFKLCQCLKREKNGIVSPFRDQ